MPNNSLFVSRNSLFLRNNSLFPNRRVPDQSAVKWRLFRSKGDLGGPGSSKFPVIFPVSREFAMETGSLRTAPTASHPAQALSLESRSAKWRGVGPRWREEELHRSKGELLSRFSDAPQAQFWLQRSFLTARRQHAKLGELRAA